VKPYVLPPGGGRVYRWHGVREEVKAAGPELRNMAGVIETTTRKGEEPHVHVHEEEDELFYVLEGEFTFEADGRRFDAGPRSFVFVPRQTPHTYKIRSDGDVRFLVLTIPSSFVDHIERTGERIEDGQ
jgi:quercetin dioxygenase-like cupin family protein